MSEPPTGLQRPVLVTDVECGTEPEVAGTLLMPLQTSLTPLRPGAVVSLVSGTGRTVRDSDEWIPELDTGGDRDSTQVVRDLIQKGTGTRHRRRQDLTQEGTGINYR